MDFITGGQLTVRITATDVGKRVSVRRLVDAGGPVEKFTDVVGVLTSWDAGVLCVTRRTGEIVRIPESALVAGKVVPAAPARRRGPAASARELDRVAARAWPPVESESLGDWTLRAAGGFTRRANSVLPLGEGPGLPLDEALGRITDWYGRRGLPAYIQVSAGAEGTQELLAAELAERGWVREVSVEVRIAALAPLADAEGGPGRVRLTRTVGDGWLARYQRSAGSAGSSRLGPGPEVLQVLGGGPSVWFATVPAEAVQPEAAAGPVEPAGPEAADRPEGADRPAAIGRCVADGRWAGFTAVEADPALRRRGLASAVMTALARRALEEGASAAYLQVETDNEGARAFYDRLGFTTHHAYHHWRAPRDSGH